VDAASIAQRCAEVDLPDGGHLVIRPVRADDKERMAEAFTRMSPRTRYRRFFAPISALSEPFLAALTDDKERQLGYGVDFNEQVGQTNDSRTISRPNPPGSSIFRIRRFPRSSRVTTTLA